MLISAATVQWQQAASAGLEPGSSQARASVLALIPAPACWPRSCVWLALAHSQFLGIWRDFGHKILAAIPGQEQILANTRDMMRA